MNTKTFLNKARRVHHGYTAAGNFSTTEADSRFEGIFPYHRGGFTTNGIVVHIDPDYKGDFSTNPTPQIDKLEKGELIAVFEVSNAHFTRACGAAIAFQPRSLKIEVNGTLTVSGKNAEIGSAECILKNADAWVIGKNWKIVEVMYRMEGEESSFLIDPMYLANAIAGMGDLLEFELYSNNFVIIKDNSREAWIKLMHDPRAE